MTGLALVLAVAAVVQEPSQADSAHRDTLASGASFRGTFLRRLPIDDPRLALVLTPGVALRSGEIGIGAAPLLSIRGGTPGAASVYVDGAPVRFQTFGTQGIGLAPNGIADVRVTTGVAPLFVADAAGGVISYVTPSGGDRLAGQLRWDSDEPFGNAITVGYNRLEASVGGPLARMRNLTIYVSTTLQGQRSAYRGRGAAGVPLYVPLGVDTMVDLTTPSGTQLVPVPQFVQWTGSCDARANGGVECQGLRRPMDWSTARRAQGKVVYHYAADSASGVSLTILGSDVQQRSFPGTAILDAGLYQGRRASSTIGILNWSHRFRGPLTLRVNVSSGRDRDVAGLLTPESEIATRDPSLGIAFETLRFTGTDVFPFPATEAIVRNVRSNTGLRTPYLNREDLRNAQPYRMNPYGLAGSGWPTQGIDGPIAFAEEKRLQGQWLLEWHGDQHHRVAVGIDGARTSLSLYQSALLRQAFFDIMVERPTRRGVFLGDRMDFGPAVLDLGLRYDRFTPGGEFPLVPGRIYTNPAWSPNSATSDTAYAASVARVFAPTRSQGALSPRFRLTAAVTRGTTFRLGYGESVEPPPYATFFHGANSDLDFTSTSEPFGRDLGFGTSSLFELGIRSALTRALGIDVSVFRRGQPAYGIRVEPFADPLNPGDTTNIAVRTLSEAAHTEGVDTRVAWRSGQWLEAGATYSLLRAYPDGVRGPFTIHALTAVVSARVPPDWSAGSLWGQLGRDLAIDMTAQVASGVSFTRLVSSGAGTAAAGGLPAFLNTLVGSIYEPEMPWVKRLDLRLTRTVRAGGGEWTMYADLRNVLNVRNTIALVTEAGDVVTSPNRILVLAPEFVNLKNEAISNSALEPDGNTINLSACGTWQNPVNCVALTRVERRFGDSDGLYTLAEQTRALNAYYDAFFGPSRFCGAGRTLRFGMELTL